MRFGCCLNMIAAGADDTGMEYLEELAQFGYDYAELPLAQMMELSPGQFEQLRQRAAKAGVDCEVCNNFFPADFRLTGPQIDYGKIIDYVEQALARAGSLGAEYVVFGSGPAKQVPEGFHMETAYQQIVTLLKDVNGIAEKNHITIVIEPLRKAECNLINTFSEGCRLAGDVAGTNIKVLVDFYHLTEEQEPVAHIVQQGREYLRHVHFARPKGRTYPESIGEENYRPFIDALKAIGYEGRVSCEAYTSHYSTSALQTLNFFKRYF